MQQYKSVSLFSGAMGLDAGLGQTNRFQVLAAVEKERAFCDTIRLNRDNGMLPPDLLVIEDDIRNVDPAKLMETLGLVPGELDVLVGGPPCQAFSTAGKRGSTQDPRGELLWEFLRFVRVMKPKFFLMENVRGLLSAAVNHRRLADRPERGGASLSPTEQAGSVVKLFADDLQQIEPAYHMDCFEVNAVNYGAPQLRERALFIGNRFNAEVDFPSPTHGSPKECVIHNDDLFAGHKPMLPWTTLRDAIGGIDDVGQVLMDFSPRKKTFLSKIPEGANWRSLPVAEQQNSMGKAWYAKGGRSGWWRRLTFDLPSPTLVTMPNHASTSLCHPTEVRALTLKEYARIQEFPISWSFSGTASQQYAQVGNAVPVRLGRIAGDVIARTMDTLVALNWRVPYAAPSHFRIVYIQSHVRTRQWFKSGETYIWKDGEDNDRSSYGASTVKRQTKRLVEA